MPAPDEMGELRKRAKALKDLAQDGKEI